MSLTMTGLHVIQRSSLHFNQPVSVRKSVDKNQAFKYLKVAKRHSFKRELHKYVLSYLFKFL